jgi:hypothetical protein
MKKMKKLGCLFLCFMGSQLFATQEVLNIITPHAQRRVICMFCLSQPSSTDSLNSLDSLFDCPVSPAPKKRADCPVRTTPSPRKKTVYAHEQNVLGRCPVSPIKRRIA